MCDFELAQANSASAIFCCAIAYCYFHLSQNLFDKIEKLKLTKCTCEKFEDGINSLKALAFLKPEHVLLGFALIYEMLVVCECDVCEPHNGKQLVPEKILQWFEKSYVRVKTTPRSKNGLPPATLKSGTAIPGF